MITYYISNFLQLRYLQTLSSIAAEHNSTIIFPMPMNILDHFMGKKSKDIIQETTQVDELEKEYNEYKEENGDN